MPCAPGPTSYSVQAAPGPPDLLNLVPAQRARLLLAQGNLPAAAGFVQQYGLGADDEPDYWSRPLVRRG